MDFTQGVLYDGALDRAVELVRGEMAVDDAHLRVPGQVDGTIGILVHEPAHASGPVAGGKGELVSVLVSQSVEELHGCIEGATLTQLSQALVDERWTYCHGWPPDRR